MTITDKRVLGFIEELECPEVKEWIMEYPEDERDGRSDIQLFANVVCYVLEDLDHDYGHPMYKELAESKRKLRETKDGKVLPLDIDTFEVKEGYRTADIQHARGIVAGYKRLKSCYGKLNKLGFY